MTTTGSTGRHDDRAMESTSVEPGSVVVGFDGSSTSVEALTWAAVEARESGAPLAVLHAADFFGTSALLLADASLGPGLAEGVALAARRTAEEGAAIARDLTATPVRALWRLAGPAEALVLASREASLVVVGHRGRGPALASLLGSVSFAVSARASSPVLVLRRGVARRPDGDHPVVVGVDGSPGSRRAVQVAADLASRYAAPLQVLSAWTPPVPRTHGGARVDPVAPGPEDRARAANAAAATAAARRHPGLVVDADVVPGAPDLVLRAASRTAGRVVVGPHSAGRSLRRTSGSVSRAAIPSFSCPVEVVHGTTGEPGRR